MAVLIEFTGLFALRCGEACALKVSDLLLQANPPQLRIRKTKGAGKSPGSIPITPEKVEYIQKLQDEGLVWKRTGKNRHGSWNVMDTYKIPDEGHLFPSKKRKRKEKNKPITYHGVWSAVNKLSKGLPRSTRGMTLKRFGHTQVERQLSPV